jgi:hypothetical protein
MLAFLTIALALICVCSHVSARPTNTVFWRAERFDYTFPGTRACWAWIILPAEHGTANRGSFEATVDSIFRSEPAPRISSVFLGSVDADPGMQKEVMDRLKDTEVLRKYPTRHDATGRMYIDGTTNTLSMKMCRLVKAAILGTTLVRQMDAALLPRGLHIGHVDTEKLCIFSENGAYHWEGFTWLIVEPAEGGGPANGSQPIRSDDNRASSAAGSRR